MDPVLTPIQPPAESVKPPVTPVQQAERLVIVDILRGFALFGILLVNMALFSFPFQSILMPADPNLPWYDRAAVWVVHFLGEGKFYSLFSLLFGLGLVLLMGRVEARGGRFVPLYLRRMLVLLCFGLVHAFLIWVGDILIMYAVIGVLLLFFRKARRRTLMIWVVILVLLPLLFTALSTALVELGRSIPEGAQQIEETFAQVGAAYQADVESAFRIYRTGSFGEITARRIYDYGSMGLFAFLVMGFNVLAMFLLGMVFGKRQIFQDLEANRPLFRRLLIWGGLLGLLLNGIYATLILDLPRYDSSWTLALATTAQGIGAPLLSLAYLSAIVLLFGRPAWDKRLAVLAPVGQMALTNYLLQSIVCTLIFYSYGLALFGKVGAGLGILLTILIYAIQIPFSHWWMKRFRYGPAEWLWRSLTYLKRQPMRRTA